MKNKNPILKNKIIYSSLLIAMIGVSSLNCAHAQYRVIDNDDKKQEKLNQNSIDNSDNKEFVILKKNNVETVNNINVTNMSMNENVKTVRQIGTQPNNLPLLKGFAKELNLLTVLKQITPDGWKAERFYNADLNKKASWTGGKNWVDTLNDISKQTDFSVIILWDKKELRILPSPKDKISMKNLDMMEKVLMMSDKNNSPLLMEKEKNITPIEQTSSSLSKSILTSSASGKFELIKPQEKLNTNVVSKNVNVDSVGVKETVVKLSSSTNNTNTNTTVSANLPTDKLAVKQLVPKNTVWLLDSNKTLKDNVEKWAKESGWNVAWLGENYPVAFSSTLYGVFDSETGPIAQLATAYSKAKQPLTFDFQNMNKTLVVENYIYEQTIIKDELREQLNHLTNK